MTPEPSNEYQKLVVAVARAEAWLRQCSDWLLATDLDMQCPMETDPLDIADALSVLKLPHAGDDGWQDIATAPKDHGRYLFITKKGTQRVDSFHPDQFSNSRHRWHERPVDPYVAWRPLPTPPAGVGDNG